MKYVTLGRSGLKVSAICLGGNSWAPRGGAPGRPLARPRAAPSSSARSIVGINFFDTRADAYNLGASETIVGKCLLGYAPRDQVVISTKFGLKMGNGPNDAGIGRKHLRHAVDAQLKRLGTDYIDVYQIHRLDAVTPLEEVMDALTALVQAGKVLYVGGSTMPAWRFAQMIALCRAQGLCAAGGDAEPLQSAAARGGARDDPALPRGGGRAYSLQPAGARRARRTAQDRARPRGQAGDAERPFPRQR